MQPKTFGKRGLTHNPVSIAPSPSHVPSDPDYRDDDERPHLIIPWSDIGEGVGKAFLLVGGLGLIALFLAASCHLVTYVSPADQAADLLRANFHSTCEALAKARLNYPGSYDTAWGAMSSFPTEKGLEMGWVFTATNAFGVPAEFSGYCQYDRNIDRTRLLQFAQNR